MNNENAFVERASTFYLVLMTSFISGALALVKAFEIAINQSFSLPSLIKVGICLLFFSACCMWINKKNFFYDAHQRKSLMRGRISFKQALVVITTLLFWVTLRMFLLGEK